MNSFVWGAPGNEKKSAVKKKNMSWCEHCNLGIFVGAELSLSNTKSIAVESDLPDVPRGRISPLLLGAGVGGQRLGGKIVSASPLRRPQHRCARRLAPLHEFLASKEEEPTEKKYHVFDADKACS